MGGTPNQILGVKIEHIRWLIDIIRTKYSTIKNGVKYLENQERKYDLTALANIRDFLSHVETMFSEGVSEQDILANRHQAEEHLRRTLLETYHIALDAKLEALLEEYGAYEKEMLPNESKYGISNITDHDRIRNNIKTIMTYINEGRKRKGGNIWNNDWEEGVEFFVQGYELASDVHNTVKGYKELYYNNKFSHDKNVEQKKLAIFLFVASILAAIIISAVFSESFHKFVLDLFKTA